MSMKWSFMTKEQKLEYVRGHKGESASQLAARIQGCSRNAMIGFLHRNKIPFGAAHGLKGAVDAAINKAKQGQERKKRELKPRPPKPPQEKKKEEPVDIFDDLPAQEVAGSTTKSIMTLRSDSCKFPLTSNFRGVDPYEILFCGAQISKEVYCTEHAKLCYSPAGYREIRDPEAPRAKKPSVRLWRR